MGENDILARGDNIDISKNREFEKPIFQEFNIETSSNRNIEKSMNREKKEMAIGQ